MTDHHTNGDQNTEPKRYAVVDHDGNRADLGREVAAMRVLLQLDALPIGGRFTVTRIA